MRAARPAGDTARSLASAGLRPALFGGLVITGAALAVAGPGAAASSFVGSLAAVVFFATASVVLILGSTMSPKAQMLLALIVYAVQMLVLLGVIVWSTDRLWFRGVPAAVGVLTVALVWQVCAVRSWRRARVLVYDAPSQTTPGVG